MWTGRLGQKCSNTEIFAEVGRQNEVNLSRIACVAGRCNLESQISAGGRRYVILARLIFSRFTRALVFPLSLPFGCLPHRLESKNKVQALENKRNAQFITLEYLIHTREHKDSITGQVYPFLRENNRFTKLQVAATSYSVC